MHVCACWFFCFLELISDFFIKMEIHGKDAEAFLEHVLVADIVNLKLGSGLSS